MRFKVYKTKQINQGTLTYMQSDYAFAFLPISRSRITSIVIDTLELPIDKDGNVLNVQGYCPYFNWKETDIHPPEYTQGSLIVELDEVTLGVSERLAGRGEWKIFFNSSNGWLCVGDAEVLSNYIAIEFASSCIAVVEGDQLKAVWLHPANLPDISK